MKIFAKLLALIVSLGVLVFGAVQAVYWFNIDNKFMYLLYLILEKHYDKVPRDRKF